MGSLRTPEQKKRYQEAIANGALEQGCALCAKKAMQTFSHWKIIQNDFPYDRIASVHHMLVPTRHITEPELTEEEYNELLELKKSHLNQNYEYLIEATPKLKSIPSHFHLHLIVSKDFSAQ